MYATRNSTRLQQEKETEHNNQLLSFFNDFLKVTCKLSILNDNIINSGKKKSQEEFGINFVDIKENDLDKSLSAKEKKAFIEVMNNIYTNLKNICYTSIEEQLRKEDEARLKKVEEKYNKKIEALIKEINSLKQNSLAENMDKSVDTSQFKKELVQLSLLYKDDRNIEENTEIFENIQYHNSFISELYLNSKEKIRSELSKDRKALSLAFESLDKEIELIHNVMDQFLLRIEMFQNKLNELENEIKDSLPSSLTGSKLSIGSNNVSSMTLINILDRLDKMQNYMNQNKENIDSIPIIQKYTYKNEQDIKDVRTRISHPKPTSIVIPDSGPMFDEPINNTSYMNNNNNNNNININNNFNNNINNNINNNFNNNNNNNNNNNGYMPNKRQKLNEMDYSNNRMPPDDLVPISNDQRTLNASGMFNNRNRNNSRGGSNYTPVNTTNRSLATSPTSPYPGTNMNANFNFMDIENRIRDLDKRLAYNFQVLDTISRNGSIQQTEQAITEKFNEICAQLNTNQLKSAKVLCDDVDHRLKSFQETMNNTNIDYINERLKSYNKVTIDKMDHSLKNINYQIGFWKRKMAEDLENQFGKTIQELKLQIVSLSKLPVKEGSIEFTTLMDFLKDVFRWNWEK